GFAVEHHLRDLPRIALMQRQPYARIAFQKGTHHPWQRIARLGVRGRDRQTALGLVAELVTDLPEVVDVSQHALGDREDLPARLGHRDQTLAVTHEDLDAEFGLELSNLFGHAGLRSK